jgi:hypothetical protein
MVDVKLASGPRGEVFAARGSLAVEHWNALGLAERAKFFQRFNLLCTATDMLDKSKIRQIKGSDRIYEIKLKKPPLRAFAFRDGAWRITHIESKPSKSQVLAEARKAERFRNEHNRRVAANEP